MSLMPVYDMKNPADVLALVRTQPDRSRREAIIECIRRRQGNAAADRMQKFIIENWRRS